MKRTREYLDKIYTTIENGGVLYAIERADTNKFLAPNLEMYVTNQSKLRKERWNDSVSLLCYLYLTEQDAKDELLYLNLTEGGCNCCGHGSISIPVKITEHEFVKI
jgi:hypothetical protein